MSTSSVNVYLANYGEIIVSHSKPMWNGAPVPLDTWKRALRLFRSSLDDRMDYVDRWMFFQTRKPVPIVTEQQTRGTL